MHALQGGALASQDAVSTAVAISSLQGKDMLLRITKRKGYELDDVLEEPSAQDSSLWGRLTSWAIKPNPLAEPSLGTGNPLHLLVNPQPIASASGAA